MASAAPNVDLFDAYFRRADLDRDGRISGAEAVSFFQGSGLPKHVLAQIWAFANQSQSGFLGRAEFYNALKLVTVAQSKRELTPEMVKAALYGPAASKIPAPQINFSATVSAPAPAPAPAPVPQIGPVSPLSHQNLGPRGAVPNLSGNQQTLPSQGNQFARPPATVATQGMARPETPGISSYGKMGGTPEVTSSPVAVRGTSPPSAQEGFGFGSNVARPPGQYPASPIKSSDQLVKDSKPVDASVNGDSSDSFFGGDLFSASSFQPKQASSPQGFSSGTSALSSAIVPVSGGNQHSTRTSTPDSLQRSLATQPVGAQLQQAQPVVKQDQHASVQTHNMPNSSGLPGRLQDSASSQSQAPWPRMTQTDVQKYMKVFMEVDTDRDGKITGEQARNLFLSWRLPREVLKQVWDLSDQDNDSMLSLREFCIALYLMERHREGRVLPAVLPSNIVLDLPTTGQPAAHYSSWGNPSAFQQQPGTTGSGARQVNPAAGRPPRPAAVSQSDEGPQNKPQKSRIPVLEKHLINQLSSDEQNSINSKFQEATEADKKVEELEKEIMESREKIEFYRAKMQELVLYKSRCDNRLNEVIERIAADKHEVEILAKKYEDKYKQVGDLSSKLTTEEATFRDIQEKKIELYQAIVKMEQDGKGDATLQAHVDRIQTDLDELVKSLNERCKKYGLRAKPTTLLELPFGWQPGIQEGAADWDEDWDKLEDKEFVFVKELTLDVQNIIVPPKQKLPSAVNTKAVNVEAVNTEAVNVEAVNTEAVNTDSPTFAASPKSDDKSEKPRTTNEQGVGNGSVYNKSEDGSVKSAPNSPFASSAIGSPHGDFDSDIRKTAGEDSSLRDQDTIQETQSDHGGVKSVFSGDKIFDEPNWGTFDTNDDIDSVWGFNASSFTKEERDLDRAGNNYFFDSGELGLNPIKTGSPQAGDFFQRSSGFGFDDSVPSTPLYSSSSSPQRPKEWLETAFDFSRFDSFRTHDSVSLPARETTEQYDSVRNSVDFDHAHGFPAFDDSDPFGSGPFRTSSDNQTPRRGSDNWSAF
ncbi:hypothetical protein GYH30_038582 [Glycine max]|uniref:Putative calcium-binding protein isoform A n=1 Tax=Glycine soja TaxID=3848 RepID=A0A445GZD0_GLYSO|nr:epidermal growth factor receptor substrate 15-like 1 [Glycine soja]KAG4952754.1 hypothetical protein JHK87_038348 [Glycine soja]KAH1092434.1 hypothetical protein GYH30_038582 [Glycine max]RZB66715.1 putative calcium-binding protein isoform A [Glycine soja]RZB66716.1 putative calcium-binding protein isoform B [Glycine soja]